MNDAKDVNMRNREMKPIIPVIAAPATSCSGFAWYVGPINESELNMLKMFDVIILSPWLDMVYLFNITLNVFYVFDV